MLNRFLIMQCNFQIQRKFRPPTPPDELEEEEEEDKRKGPQTPPDLSGLYHSTFA